MEMSLITVLMFKFNPFIRRYLCLLPVLLCATQVDAGNVDNLASELARIRGDVEELQTRLDQQKEAHHNRMAALSSQLTDLSVEQRRQSVTIEKIQLALQNLAEHNADARNSGDSLKPVLLEVLEQYRVYVKDGFPFKIEERLAAIQSLRDQLSNDLIEPKKAANRMWAFIEDEIRLSKENGIYQQTIELNGQRVLADVAKLGSVLLYFQTRDNRIGLAKKQKRGGWVFVTLDDSRDRERVALLFESLKKQIRQGYFELPNPLQL